MAAALACVLVVAACGSESAKQPDRSWIRDARLAFERGGSTWLVDADWNAHRLEKGTEPRWARDVEKADRVDVARARKVASVVDEEISDFAWTPDRHWLMYTVGDGGEAAGLWRITPDGRRREKLLSRVGYTELAVSPDGKYAAVAATGAPSPALDVIELQDGILVHRFPGVVSSPDWRPARGESG